MTAKRRPNVIIFFITTCFMLSYFTITGNANDKNDFDAIIENNSKIKTYKTQVKLKFDLDGHKDLVTFNVDIERPNKYYVIQHAFKQNLWDKWVSINGDHYYYYGKDEVILKNAFQEDIENKNRTNESLEVDKFIILLDKNPDSVTQKKDSCLLSYQNLKALEKFPMFVGDLIYNVDIIIDKNTHSISQADINASGKLGNGQQMSFVWIQKFNNYNAKIAIEKPKVTKQ